MVRNERAGAFKVGSSCYPGSRIASFQSWSPDPLTLLFSVPGTRQHEQAIHLHFADLHLHGEWFRWRESAELEARELLAAGRVSVKRLRCKLRGESVDLSSDSLRELLVLRHRLEQLTKGT